MSKGNIIAPQMPPKPAEHQPKHLGAPSENQTIQLADIPTLKDVKLRDLAKNETDWLLVYVYYASKGGSVEFTSKDIIQLYKETDRYTDNRRKNLSAYIKSISKARYIKSTNDTNFILLEKGNSKAVEIFSGNSNSKAAGKLTAKTGVQITPKSSEKKTDESKGKKAKTVTSVGFVDLKLTPAEQKSLNDFFGAKQPKTQNEKVITVMKWFIDDKKTDEVSKEEMNYLLSIAAETPSALQQVLGNMIGSGFRWVTKGERGKYKLSSIGENYVVNKLPRKSK